MKNRKRTAPSAHMARVPRQYPVNFPDVVNMDDLATMTDEELITRLRALDEARQKVLDSRMSARAWEDEIAYLRREFQLRRQRRDAHQAYVQTLESEFQQFEQDLPVADLDNSAFVRAAGAWN